LTCTVTVLGGTDELDEEPPELDELDDPPPVQSPLVITALLTRKVGGSVAGAEPNPSV
jgi:hypothetical protein